MEQIEWTYKKFWRFEIRWNNRDSGFAIEYRPPKGWVKDFAIWFDGYKVTVNYQKLPF